MFLTFDKESKHYKLSEEPKSKPELASISIPITQRIIEVRDNLDLPNQAPMFWRWISELVDDTERDILQEYLGLCMIPSRDGQSALHLYGSGGEGKSLITELLRIIFGKNSNVISTVGLVDLAKSNFKGAYLENTLVVIDDDMQCEAIRETGTIKSLITEPRMNLERKGKDARECPMYNKLICYGNQKLQSIYDHTTGFWRRWIPLQCKPVDFFTRENISYEKFTNAWKSDEKIYIIAWLIAGLERFLANGGSGSSFSHQEFIEKSRLLIQTESDNVLDFLQNCDKLNFTGLEEDFVDIDKLYAVYGDYCVNESDERPTSQKAFKKRFFEQLRNNTKVKINDKSFLNKDTRRNVNLGDGRKKYTGVTGLRCDGSVIVFNGNKSVIGIGVEAK